MREGTNDKDRRRLGLVSIFNQAVGQVREDLCFITSLVRYGKWGGSRGQKTDSKKSCHYLSIRTRLLNPSNRHASANAAYIQERGTPSSLKEGVTPNPANRKKYWGGQSSEKKGGEVAFSVPADARGGSTQFISGQRGVCRIRSQGQTNCTIKRARNKKVAKTSHWKSR